MTVAFLPSSTVQTAQANGVASFTFDSNGIQSGVEASLKSITASIASNAITVTLPPITLDFRSTTLTNGAPTQIQTTSTLSLTIASTDSFGLTTAFGNQRLAILAINNAGTVELAASALYGGVNLDETGVITTATASTTATAIKAGAVRTGVAYRVVGFVDATFTTATGWGSLALVQGQGGQALNAMSSLGYGQTWQNVFGSRASGTTYYNTTGKPILVQVNTTLAANSELNPVVGGVTLAGTNFSVTGGGKAYVTFIVQPSQSYSVTLGLGTIERWVELR